ncbi:MAG: MFS transporter [Chloroflexi bacterium]|nr:MFS transporter [Chloroflexota bacterium]
MAQAPARRAARWQSLGALRYPRFRVFWISLVAFVGAMQVLQVVFAWALYDMTGSAFLLGLLGGVTSVPTILTSLAGGVIADRMDRRLLLVVAMALQALVVTGVAVLAVASTLAPWHLLLAAGLLGAIAGVDAPARQAILPDLVERKDLMNAVALFTSVWQGTRIVGPFLGGVLLETMGLAACFALVAASFLGAMLLLLLIRTTRARGRTGEGFLRQMSGGLGFIRRNTLFSSLIGMTFFNSFFGMSYIFLLPIFAKDILGVGATGLGLLMGSSALGGLVGTLAVAALGRERHRNALLLGGASLFGTTLILFAYLHRLPLPVLPWSFVLLNVPITATVLAAILVLALSGAGNSAYMITIMTILQATVPDELRGRVMGVHGLTWSVMPLGGLQGGMVANFLGAPFAVALGGSAVIVYTVAVAARAGFRRRVLGAALARS